MEIGIYGAKSIALGVCRAVEAMYPEVKIVGFFVSDKSKNTAVLEGHSVYQLDEYGNKGICMLIATPEDVQDAIIRYLEENEFHNHICLSSHMVSKIMERYYDKLGCFPSIHKLRKGKSISKLNIFMAKFHRDKAIKTPAVLPDWVIPIQVGASLTEERIADIVDCEGENISKKNGNYCELTALYWIWKNLLSKQDAAEEYFGLYHYRRFLDVSQEDILCLAENKIDVVLPFPTVHAPDIREHHARYITESIWQSVLRVLREIEPDYSSSYDAIFHNSYFYNYNIIIARRQVLKKYCEWLFPILEKVETLHSEENSRYIGYVGENLLTLYFLTHQNEYKIVHTGTVMYV